MATREVAVDCKGFVSLYYLRPAFSQVDYIVLDVVQSRGRSLEKAAYSTFENYGGALNPNAS